MSNLLFIVSCVVLPLNTARAQCPDLDEQVSLATGVFAANERQPMEEVDVAVYQDSVDERWNIRTRTHVLDGFVDAHYTWNDSIHAFCASGNVRGRTLNAITPNCTETLVFDRIRWKDGSIRIRMRRVLDGRVFIHYQIQHGQ